MDDCGQYAALPLFDKLTELSGSRVIFYRPGAKIAPDHLRAAINEALTATKLLCAACQNIRAEYGAVSEN